MKTKEQRSKEKRRRKVRLMWDLSIITAAAVSLTTLPVLMKLRSTIMV